MVNCAYGRDTLSHMEGLPELHDEWLTAAEAAAYLKVSKATLYRLCAQGVLPFYTIGGKTDRRFKRSELDAAMRRETPSSEPLAA